MKLEDINKKNIYSVPDKYFDQLPGRVQARIEAKKPGEIFSLNWSLTYKLAAPALAMVMLVLYFWYDGPANNQSAESLLAQVATDDLVAYLATTDITTDEILESIDFDNIELDLSDETPIMKDTEMNEESINSILDEFGVDEDLL
ncbi:MAG: hypothetical protein U5K79_00275 [Cyclobacteriaceae bacterium]|nr:hypothetical protein [Cyclobacteriaceae bacterium]